jgi:hypothetical protein
MGIARPLLRDKSIRGFVAEYKNQEIGFYCGDVNAAYVICQRGQHEM